MSRPTEEQGIGKGSFKTVLSPSDTNYVHSAHQSTDTAEPTAGSLKVDDSDSQSSRAKSINNERSHLMIYWQRLKAYLIPLKPLFVMLFINIGLSLAIYYLTKQWLSALVALILSGIPPLLRVVYEFWKRRNVDVLGCIVILSFFVSALVSIISGDARLALLRESATTAIISIMFFITLIPLKTRWFCIRPLVFLIYSQMTENREPKTWTDATGEQHSMKLPYWVWDNFSIFRIYCYTLSGLWGFLLMGEFIAKVVMIEATDLDIDHILLYGQVIVIVVTVAMTVATLITSRFVTQRIINEAKEWDKRNDFTDSHEATLP